MTMTHRRRGIGAAALAVLIAAGIAWYRFAPGDAPAGQSPPAFAEASAGKLATIDAAVLEGLRADFNRHRHETRLIVLLSPT